MWIENCSDFLTIMLVVGERRFTRPDVRKFSNVRYNAITVEWNPMRIKSFCWWINELLFDLVAQIIQTPKYYLKTIFVKNGDVNRRIMIELAIDRHLYRNIENLQHFDPTYCPSKSMPCWVRTQQFDFVWKIAHLNISYRLSFANKVVSKEPLSSRWSGSHKIN